MPNAATKLPLCHHSIGGVKRQAAFGYWTHGRLLTELANCRRPAVCGVKETSFTLELHDDVERFSTYRKSKIRLADYGYGLLASEKDFVQDNAIDRWWGGTHLVSNHVWRMDTAGQSLVAPN